MKTDAQGKQHSRTGRYSYMNKWERLCACGATLGEHTAEAPHDLDETGCEGFKPAGKARS